MKYLILTLLWPFNVHAELFDFSAPDSTSKILIKTQDDCDVIGDGDPGVRVADAKECAKKLAEDKRPGVVAFGYVSDTKACYLKKVNKPVIGKNVVLYGFNRNSDGKIDGYGGREKLHCVLGSLST